MNNVSECPICGSTITKNHNANFNDLENIEPASSATIDIQAEETK